MDPEAIESTLSKTAETAEGPESTVRDEKTDELVNSLESSVDKAYSKIQDSTLSGFSKISGMVSEKLPELQKQWNDVKLPQIPDVNVNVNVNELTKNINNLNIKLDDYVKKEDLDVLKQRGGEFITKASENTNKVLDDLDNDLEKIENLTINYAQQIGGQIGTFFKAQLNNLETNSDDNLDSKNEKEAPVADSWNWSGWGKQLTSLISGDAPEKVVSEEKKIELLFSLPEGISPGTRAESQVHELQSDSSIYLKSVESGEFNDYKLSDEQNAEIKDLLNNNSLHLMQVYRQVVNDAGESGNSEEESSEVNKISSENFWKVYFGKSDQIMKDERKRRELLEKSKNVEENGEDEDFDWDE